MHDSGQVGSTTAFPRWRALFVLAILVAVVLWIGASYRNNGLIALLLRGERTAEERVQAVREYFLAFGSLGPIVYMMAVTIEVVVAPIPGTMLYAPGGMIFGWVVGGSMSLLGNVWGAAISCLATRTLGGARIEHWFAKGAFERFAAILRKRGTWIIFLLRVNPLTSSDLVSYAAGLTTIPVWKVMLGTLFGMGPLCFAQAYLADSLLTALPGLIYPLLLACIAYAVVVIAVVRSMVMSTKTNNRSGPHR